MIEERAGLRLKLEYSLRLKKSAMIGCLRTRVRKEPIIALYFESENELKFYNLEAWLLIFNCVIAVMWLFLLRVSSLQCCTLVCNCGISWPYSLAFLCSLQGFDLRCNRH